MKLDPRAFALRLALTSAIVWTIGALGLLSVALITGRQAGDTAFDLHLESRAWAVYGLAWFDVDGDFHGEVLAKEDELLRSGIDVYILSPTDLVYASPYNTFQPDLQGLAADVIEAEEERIEDGVDAAGNPYRLVATPTYDDADRLVAAVIVLGDPKPVNAAWTAFAVKMVAVSALLIALGIAFSVVMARRAMARLEVSIRDRHQVLAAAAHELRTPIATLQAMVESAREGDEPAELALEKLAQKIGSTGEMLDRLLTWSRLTEAPLQPERLRLDLLVETLLHDGETADLTESVVTADPRLLRIAIANLLENARRHGGGIRKVTVHGGEIGIADKGPGFPEIPNLTDPFVRGPRSSGAGLGLALVLQIATVHGGKLALGPGAEVRLQIPC